MNNLSLRKILNSRSGFTLVETLVVIFVLSTIAVLVSVIIVSSLRGTNKTNTITTVRQNGFFAIAQMTKLLQNAKRLEDPYPCITPPSPTPLPPPPTSLKITSSDGTTTVLACNAGSPPTIGLNNDSLLDTNAVSLTSCSFTCQQEETNDFPIIGISFTLAQKKVTSFFEQTVSIPFQTSVVMRNLNQ